MRLRLLVPAFGLTLAALGGCTDSRSGTMLVSPARFTLYNCQELATHQATLVSRQRDLEGLMARANRESAGRIVSVAAYQPEYQTVLGEMKVLRQEAAQKDCKLPDPYAPPLVAAKPAKPAKPKR